MVMDSSSSGATNDMRRGTESHIPPLRFRWLTPAYDAVIRLLLREDRLREALVKELNPDSGERLLDLGCGTGTLMLALKGRCPACQVAGIDIDADAMRIARRKAAAAGADVTFFKASITREDALAVLGEEAFDTIVSCLVFHHLTRDGKLAAMQLAWRALRPGGRFLLADWGPMRTWRERTAFLPVRLLDGLETTADNAAGRLPAMLAEAGFENVEVRRRHLTIFGPLTFLLARRPENRVRSRNEEDFSIRKGRTPPMEGDDERRSIP